MDSQHAHRGATKGALVAFAVWLVAAGAWFLYLRVALTPEEFAVFSELEVDLPGLTVLTLDAGSWLQSPVGTSAAVVALLLSVVPFWRGARARGATKLYGALAAVAMLGLAGTWAGTELPLQKLQEALEADDRSLAVAEYERRGLPALEREWTADDYGTALDVLSGLASRDPAQLPVVGSSRSSAVIDKLCDRAALEPLTDTTISLDARAESTVALGGAVSGVLRLYFFADDVDVDFESTRLRLMGFMLHMNVATASVGRELLDRADPDAPDFAARERGMAQVATGCEQMLRGALMVLEDPSVDDSSASRLAADVAETYPVLVRTLSPTVRRDLEAFARRVAKDASDTRIRTALERMLDSSATPR